MTRLSGRTWLLVPAAGLLAADVTLTLAGQPPEYWGGDRSAVNEANPVARPLLAVGPEVFLVAAAVWLVAVSVVVLLWRHRAAEWTAVALAVGHAVAGACWVGRQGGWWLLAAGGYVVVASLLSRWCWRRAEPTAPPA